ncbi:hypothetical protein BCR34DRAFT_570152 [Clohesyomyces aquaticus]|uniref:Uncharacterized protein n=1 Tax=Clohesyomyces aquaticus TaxID=1231657 RepID=A0A1Y1ZCY0_9PLEO|nr:hypothetical protein BCR34DRAFT_570152 [Clohesyomyces aquaticus]
MTSIQQKLQDASAQNTHLLSGLRETASAPSELSQHESYIHDLTTQLRSTQKRVSDLKAKTAAELKDHKKYSESTFRRIAHKASGRKDRFAEKAQKEEREYFYAIQEQKTGEDDLAYVRQLLAEAESKKQELIALKEKHEALQRELDALYTSIFEGYTPEFPDEDEKEHAYQNSSEYVRQASQNLEKTKHVLFLLRETGKKLHEATKHLASAHSMSTYDMFGGGTLSSMQKRNYLERAESAISQVRILQNQIAQLDPNAADLGPMMIASGSIWSDIVFDNIFSDMDMHDKIKDSEMQLERAGKKFREKMRVVEGREKEERGEVQRAGEGMERARMELQMARERAFESVGGGAGGSVDGGHQSGQLGNEEAPPPYTA